MNSQWMRKLDSSKSECIVDNILGQQFYSDSDLREGCHYPTQPQQYVIRRGKPFIIRGLLYMISTQHDIHTGFLSQGGAKLHVFRKAIAWRSAQLSNSFSQKPGIKKCQKLTQIQNIPRVSCPKTRKYVDVICGRPLRNQPEKDPYFCPAHP